jgi:hypothetical protein
MPVVPDAKAAKTVSTGTTPTILKSALTTIIRTIRTLTGTSTSVNIGNPK